MQLSYVRTARIESTTPFGKAGHEADTLGMLTITPGILISSRHIGDLLRWPRLRGQAQAACGPFL